MEKYEYEYFDESIRTTVDERTDDQCYILLTSSRHTYIYIYVYIYVYLCIYVYIIEFKHLSVKAPSSSLAMQLYAVSQQDQSIHMESVVVSMLLFRIMCCYMNSINYISLQYPLLTDVAL